MNPDRNPNIPDLITDADLDRFVDRLLHRGKQFLELEGKIPVMDVRPIQGQLDRMELKDLTSILTVEDRLKLIVAFSFDRSLMEAVFQGYTEGVSVAPEEQDLLMEETAGDCINIVVGNALEDFQLPGYAFNVSTPIIINEGKSIQRYKQSKLTAGEVQTEKGTMIVLCITPGIYYKNTLEIEASE